MSGSTDPYRAIFEHLVEKAEKKAKAKGKTIFKPKPKSKKVLKCKSATKLN